MKIIKSIHLLLSFLFACSAPAKEAPAGDSKGAIIIAGLVGDVKVQVNGKLDPDGKATGALLPQEEVKAGASIFDGHTVIVGKAKGSSAILLFSNGTVTTLKEDSQLNVRTFTQAKFESKPDQKISDLEEEPSSSKTDINLNFGDMVVDIKKLSKKSSFDIASPVGTAGIRGTTVALGVRPAPGGGFRGSFVVPKGLISFRPPRPIPTIEVPNPPEPAPIPVAAGEVIPVTAPERPPPDAPLRPAAEVVQPPPPPPPEPAPPLVLKAATDTVAVAVQATAEVTLDTVTAAVEVVETKVEEAAPERIPEDCLCWVAQSPVPHQTHWLVSKNTEDTF